MAFTEHAQKTTDERKVFKPLKHQWAMEACDTQHKMHWLPYEVDLQLDLKEFEHHLTDGEKKIIISILRFFTQTDIEVARCYLDYYIPIFRCPEIRMMLTTFANMEVIHIMAYSYLITTLKLPDEEYSAFMQYKEMVSKYDYMQSFDTNSPEEIAVTLAIVSGFIEGFVLYGSFTILLAPAIRRAKSCLKGVAQIVTFSMRDETLHSLSIIRLFHIYCEENKDKINFPRMRQKILDNCKILIDYEIQFVNLAFGDNQLDYLQKEDVINFLKFLADVRLKQLGLNAIYGIEKNPLPWMESYSMMEEKVNFFETAATSYTKGDIVNNQDDIFDSYVTNRVS